MVCLTRRLCALKKNPGPPPDAEFNNKRLYCVRQARCKFYGGFLAGIELGGYKVTAQRNAPPDLESRV